MFLHNIWQQLPDILTSIYKRQWALCRHHIMDFHSPRIGPVNKVSIVYFVCHLTELISAKAATLAADYSWLCPDESDSPLFLAADMLICHNRESPGETNGINNGSVPAISEGEFDKSKRVLWKGSIKL